MSPRHTGRGLVIRDGQILLMERWRPGQYYFSIPGGGIEKDETPEQAAVREIAEETTLDIRVIRKVFQMLDGDVIHHIFLCEYLSGEPHLPENSEEFLLNATDNRFKPGWFDIHQLDTLPFKYWKPLKQPLIDALADGFGEDITIVKTATTK
jgi:8-oxo-dGTP diphosphatase